MAVRTYTKTKTIGGKEYTAQFNGLSNALDAIDNSYMDKSDRISIRKISGYIFEHVIVEPKGLTADDFDDMDELNEVVRFGMEVMQGKFRGEQDTSGTEKAGEKA